MPITNYSCNFQHQHEELLLQTRRQRPHIINLSSNETDDGSNYN